MAALSLLAVKLQHLLEKHLPFSKLAIHQADFLLCFNIEDHKKLCVLFHLVTKEDTLLDHGHMFVKLNQIVF